MEIKPKISIITVTYNNASGLSKTLDSILSQIGYHVDEVEHIIIDNVSKDDTEKIVNQYLSKNIMKTIYIREPDTGIFNAMNKGIDRSKGEYLFFLNGGDWFVSKNILKIILKKYLKGRDIYYGDINQVYNDHSEMWSLKNITINKSFFINNSLFHQATFIKKDLFLKYGRYDESLKIVGDFDFFIKVVSKNIDIEYIPLVVVNYDAYGRSSKLTNNFIIERTGVLLRYFFGKVYWYNRIKNIYYQMING